MKPASTKRGRRAQKIAATAAALEPTRSVQSHAVTTTIPPVIELTAAIPPTPAAEAASPMPVLHLSGVSSSFGSPLKLAGTISTHAAIFMVDSGASSEFIDTEFARRCGLKMTPSSSTIRLADGSSTTADGRVTIQFHLTPRRGEEPIPFTAVLTATPLKGYDAILGMTWLAAHDVLAGFRQRTIEIRTPNTASRFVNPLKADATGSPKISAITVKELSRAHRRGEVEEIFALFVTPKTKEPAAAAVAAAAVSAAAAAPSQHPAVAAMLMEYADVFPDKLPDGLPPNRGVQHRIVMKPGSAPPLARPLHHQSAKDLAVFEEYTRSMIESGQLRISDSPYGAMALIVRKKDGTARVVVDYRALNDITVKNKYPLPLMDELFDRVVNAKVFSKLDLRTGFHQIRVHDDDVAKTAFRTRYGSFEYRVLPMGLCNAPGTFMQLMNDTFRDLLDRSVLVFLDDILVYSSTIEEHVVHIRQVLDRLRSAKLYAKLSKCEFAQPQVEFLGHHIGAAGLSVMQDKIAAVREWPIPKNISDVRSFLGLAGFYRRFVKGFSDIALPITELTKTTTGEAFAWTPRHDVAFAKLKESLTSAPVLLIADPSLPFTLNCDACNYAIGATLQQDQGNGLQPIAYMSRKLKPAEINYDTREKEFLALVDACRHWRHYLHSDLPFKLLSDHDSLKYHKTMPHLSGRIARWVERMSEFDYDIEHIAGVKNVDVVADALLRRIDMKDEPDAASLAAAQLRPGRPRPPVDPVAAEARRINDRAAAEVVQSAAADRPLPDKDGVIKMPSQRCTAGVLSGEQCKARTAMGQYCWNHLRTIVGLRIKKSTVVGAGRGLWAARALKKGYRIPYTGDRVPLTDEIGGAYFLQLTRHIGIDAARTNSGEGRWINDPRGTGLRPNCAFHVYTPRGQPRIGCVRTLRPIQAGEELMISYGPEYWKFFEEQQALKRLARKRGRPRKRRPQAAVIADIDTTDTDSLTGAIHAAAALDATYLTLLVTPPADTQVHSGLLWDAAGQRLYVPSDTALRTRVIAHCHDDLTGAHFGRDKTLAAVQQRFCWRGLTADVELYVKTCDTCQRTKLSQQLTPGALMPLPLPEHPCREWTNDAVTGLPKTKRSNDAIQVYVERMCKLKHFVASKKTDGAKELAGHFVHTVVRAHGVPDKIVSDRDPRFTAHYYRELAKLIGTKVSMSTARHPQSDGQSEREIKTLITALRAYCNAHQDDWDDYLDMLELGFNSTVQASTRASPFELLYGTKPRLPIDVAMSTLAPRNPAAVDRATRMRDGLKFAREHLLTAQASQIRNASRRQASFAIGDLVLLTTHGLALTGTENKLTTRWLGPFPVVGIVNNNAYTLRLPTQLQALHATFNIDKLKRYHSTEQFATRPAQMNRPPPDALADSNGDQQWEVERVTAQRYKGRRMEFLVRWRGYPIEESTWEPRSGLAGAPDALSDWESASRD